MPHFLLIFRRIVIYAIKQIVAVTISNIDILHNKSIFTSLEVNAAVYQTRIAIDKTGRIFFVIFHRDFVFCRNTVIHLGKY